MSYDAVGTAIKYIGKREYEVRLDDGAVVIAAVAVSETDDTIPNGASVGLFAMDGGWSMQLIKE